VLEEVGETLAVGGVVDLADVYDEGRAGLVELLVGDEEDAQAVIEDEAAELRGVGGRDDAGRQRGHGCGGESGGGEQGEGGGENERQAHG